MRHRIGRRAGATTVVALLAVAGMLVAGVSVAGAATFQATIVRSVNTSGWSPPSGEPSGVAYLPSSGRLIVVDTNFNQSSNNGWEYTLSNGQVVNRATGVNEPTGVDYDPGTNTLFISSDDNEGPSIHVLTNFGTAQETLRIIDTEVMGSEDTEDPAYDQTEDILYFVDGSDSLIFRVDPGADEIFGTSDDSDTSYSVEHLNPSEDRDWEGLAWDPVSGNLLLGNRRDPAIYEINKNNGTLINTINVPGNITYISGLGTAPSTQDSTQRNIWVSDRGSSSLFELTTGAPSPTTTTIPASTTSSLPTTTTTQAATTTTQATTTTTGATTTTTQATTTTTAATTTTTSQGSTTTTTIPGATTTTTIPGNTTTTTVPNNPPPPPPPGEFSDTNGHVFENAISWLSDKGITKGCNPPANTEFCPDDFVTRGQMAAFLVRAFGYTDNGGGDLFTDDDASVFENAIDRLRTAGVTQGCNPPTNSRFCPDGLVTRGQMAAFLGRAFEYTVDGGGDWFIDDNGSVFEGAIDRLRTAGVTQGCNPPLNNRYCPDDFVTRGQMAAFLKRAFGE